MIAAVLLALYPSFRFIRLRFAWFKLSPLELGREGLYVSRPGRRVLRLRGEIFARCPVYVRLNLSAYTPHKR